MRRSSLNASIRSSLAGLSILLYVIFIVYASLLYRPPASRNQAQTRDPAQTRDSLLYYLGRQGHTIKVDKPYLKEEFRIFSLKEDAPLLNVKEDRPLLNVKENKPLLTLFTSFNVCDKPRLSIHLNTLRNWANLGRAPIKAFMPPQHGEGAYRVGDGGRVGVGGEGEGEGGMKMGVGGKGEKTSEVVVCILYLSNVDRQNDCSEGDKIVSEAELLGWKVPVVSIATFFYRSTLLFRTIVTVKC